MNALYGKDSLTEECVSGERTLQAATVATLPSGDPLDVEAVYRAHAPALWRALLASSGGHRDFADDALSESFLRLLTYRRVVRDPVPWLYRTAFRILRDLQRKARRSPPGTQSQEQGGQDELFLMEALSKLSRTEQMAVSLHYVEDLPLAEMSTRTGMSVAALKVHLFRARRKLRNFYQREDVDG